MRSGKVREEVVEWKKKKKGPNAQKRDFRKPNAVSIKKAQARRRHGRVSLGAGSRGVGRNGRQSVRSLAQGFVKQAVLNVRRNITRKDVTPAPEIEHGESNPKKTFEMYKLLKPDLEDVHTVLL